MIIEWLASIASGFLDFVTGLFPPVEIPDWILNADDYVTSLIDDYGEGMGAWVDWTFAGVLAGITLTFSIGALTFRAVRAAVAHVPFVGGKG